MLPKNRAEARPGTTQTTPGPEAIVSGDARGEKEISLPAAGRLGNDGFQHSRSQLSRLARVLVCG